MSKIIGIDLGSTLSEVAIMEGGKPTILINEEGSRTTPSAISLKNGERKIGAAAKRQAVVNPKETVLLIKRFMGGTYDEVKDNISHVQYDVKNVSGYPKIVIEGKEYTPEELSAMILTKMKTIAENYLGETVTDAVITVPALFSNEAREATKKAGQIAGLNVLRIIAEPTAAILASGIDMEKGGKYMVLDYGGATLDFSVADIADGVVEIKSSYGDVYCGGSDIDKLITNWIVDEFKKSNGIDLSKDVMAMSRVLETAEKAKIELSSSLTTEINLPYITVVDNVPQHLVLSLTRANFERLIDSEIKKVIDCGKKALEGAKITAKELNGILLVGGSTRILYLQEQLTKTFGVELIKTVNPDEVVACGAAVQGSLLDGSSNDMILLDVTPLSLGIQVSDGSVAVLIDANTTIPCEKTQIFSTAVDNQPGVQINVLQGNRPMAKDNKQIGLFNLDGIAPAPRGVPQISVKFSINVDGILSVSATDNATGKEQHITIEAKGGLSDADIERMKKEAEEHADADKKEKENIDKLNGAESFVFSIEKSISEFGDKITEEEKESVKEPLDTLKTIVSEKRYDDVENGVKALEDKWNPIIQKIYTANQDNTSAETQSET